MNLLDANDRRGTYPDSWYAATAEPLPPFPALRGQIAADLCVIGGGYTGLSAALHAAEAGQDVVLVEAQRVGFGASGRNGGQVGARFNLEAAALEKRVGSSNARLLQDVALEAATLTRTLAKTHAPDAGYRAGIIHAIRHPRDVSHAHASATHLSAEYGDDTVKPLSRDELTQLLGTDIYAGGTLDLAGGHLHPLRYAFGLARACVAAGVRVFELSRVHHIAHGPPAKVQAELGQVTASRVIIGTNGYGTELSRGTQARVMPINNFIAATEPLGDLADTILPQGHCAHDDRFVVNYFRLSEDKRLLFGGGESYGYRFPADIAAKVRKPMEQVYPQLEGVRIEHAWGGTLAITMSRLPYLAQPAPHILVASGYSGSGVALASLAGKLMAEASSTPSHQLRLLQDLPTAAFPGAGALRKPLLTLAMTWYALRDRIGV